MMATALIGLILIFLQSKRRKIKLIGKVLSLLRIKHLS